MYSKNSNNPARCLGCISGENHHLQREKSVRGRERHTALSRVFKCRISSNETTLYEGDLFGPLLASLLLTNALQANCHIRASTSSASIPMTDSAEPPSRALPVTTVTMGTTALSYSGSSAENTGLPWSKSDLLLPGNSKQIPPSAWAERKALCQTQAGHPSLGPYLFSLLAS